MGLIKSIVRRRRKFAQARSLRAAGLPYLFRDTSFSVAERGGTPDAETEARKCFPSIVASAGENSL